MSLWVKLIDCTDPGGIITTRKDPTTSVVGLGPETGLNVFCHSIPLTIG